jgi:hypothetical protein
MNEETKIPIANVSKNLQDLMMSHAAVLASLLPHSPIYGPVHSLNRKEASLHLSTLDKVSVAYQEISRILLLPAGLYTCRELKICTLESKLLGGVILQSFLKALESPNSAVQAEAKKVWNCFFGKDPSKKAKKNTQILSNLEVHVTKSADQKKLVNVLSHFDTAMEEALERASKDEKHDIAGQFEELKKDIASYKPLFQPILREHIFHATRTPIDLFKNIVEKWDSKMGHIVQLEENYAELREVPSQPQQKLKISVQDIAFGKAAWAQYFGDIGKEPPLPPDIEQILNSPCPFWKDQKVHETHLLTLIPQIVNETPFTLDSLEELVKNPKEGNPAKYKYYLKEVQEELGSRVPFESYWVLMTRRMVPRSQLRKFEAQKSVLLQYQLYDMPYLLEAATTIFMEYVRTKTRLYINAPLALSYCQDRVTSQPDTPLVIGGFSPEGLDINHYYFSIADGDWYYGMGAVRRF